MSRHEALPSFPSDGLEATNLLRGLPALPSIVRYLDEYDDTIRSVRTADAQWSIKFDTASLKIDFRRFETDELVLFSKHFFAFALLRASCSTVKQMYYGIQDFFDANAKIYDAICLQPYALAEYWNRHVVATNRPQEQAIAVKWLFYFMCDMAVGHFNSSYKDVVKSLPFTWIAHYKGIANGEDILTVAQECDIVHHLDAVTEVAVRNPADLADETLTKACLLCISYQHALRPVQICRINVEDIRFYEDNDGEVVVHLIAYRAKKRDANEKSPFVVKIKADWTPLFAEYLLRRKLGPVWQKCGDAGGKLFSLSRMAIVNAIGDVVEEVTGERRTATILRHTAAQRMADGGASVEEVAEFLGHSDLDTCLIYFEASPTQAELVNRAMALSPIYSRIAEVIATGVIDKAALVGLPADQQIGGIPHGVPIAGIGACSLGQALCAKNPVLSCYGCRKFVPVSDEDIHRQVLADLRGVVQFFFDEARGGIQSQSYRQLASTLEAIQSVINSVKMIGEVPV